MTEAVSEGEILAGIREVVERHLELPEETRRRLDRSTRLRDDLALDSLQMFTLAVEVENFFRVRLTPEDDAAIVTAGDLITAVRRRLEQDAMDRTA